MRRFDNEFLIELDQLIRLGEIAKVQMYLNEIDINSLDRKSSLAISAIARRAGYHRLTLKLLYPVIRSEKPVHPPALDFEKFEYAVGLMRIGALNEAHELLKKLDFKKLPEVRLYQAAIHVNRWDYPSAIPLLESYSKNTELTAYQRLVGEINLAEAHYFAFSIESSQKLLDQVFREIKPESMRLLLGKAHELQANIFRMSNQKARAQKHLEEAQDLIGSDHHRYQTNLELLDALLTSDAQALKSVRKSAEKKHLYETVRECDLNLALLLNDQKLLLKVYFGTPHQSYRERILRLYGQPLNLPQFLDIAFSPPSPRIFDIENGIELGTTKKMKLGQLNHRLIQILAMDSYRPVRPETLFSLLFPDQFFDPKAFGYRVHNVMKRLRAWLSENNIPILISDNSSGFFITCTDPYTLRICGDLKEEKPSDHFYKKLQEAFNQDWFTTSDVATKLVMSSSSAKRSLSQIAGGNRLLRQGQGKSTKYRLVG